MDEDRLYHDPALVDFYDLENDGRDDFNFCARLAEGADSVLDLGCGTGEFAVSLAGTRTVFGVDPAEPMLAIGRAKPGAEGVTFVAGDARTIRLGRRFDLIVLTGHAFQVFLSDADRRAVLETIAAHLTPGGRFIFDSRNPQQREWEEWTPALSQRVIEHPRFGAVEAWNDVAYAPETGIVTYETHYAIAATGTRLAASSRIAFPDKDTLAATIAAAGLTVERWLGDWEETPWHADAKEIIPIGRLHD